MLTKLYKINPPTPTNERIIEYKNRGYKRMNAPTISELSLYQLTQTTDPGLTPLTVSAATFREWIDTAVQFLIDQISHWF